MSDSDNETDVMEHPVIPPGYDIVIPRRLESTELVSRPPLPVHRHMKPVPSELVAKVVENAPMPRIDRNNDIPTDEARRKEVLTRFLSSLFPELAGFDADYSIIDYSDEQLDAALAAAIESYRQLGLVSQIEITQKAVERFKATRGMLQLLLEHDLVRRDTVLPIEYLPDLFMAVPVWYFWSQPEMARDVSRDWDNDDPYVHSWVEYFCKLFPNQQWHDVFQLFNRRIRTLKQYEGDVIPPEVALRIEEAVKYFDYVVIATPYHDVAGRDWEDIDWLRSIDPYVLGFKEGVPNIFVLARFSDSGTFPLYNELVADTIDFLRKNKLKLDGFNHTEFPYWASADERDSRSTMRVGPFGNYLMAQVDALLKHFERGQLFDWLRDDVEEEKDK